MNLFVMGRRKKIVHDYTDLERFPIRETVCDFSRLEKIKAPFVSIRTLGCNIRVIEKGNNYVEFSNCDLYRINAPYWRGMEKFKNVITNYLTSKGISYQELLF